MDLTLGGGMQAAAFFAIGYVTTIVSQFLNHLLWNTLANYGGRL